MANDITGRPFVLDTPSTTVPFYGTIKDVRRIWTTGFTLRDYAAAGAIAQIKDGVRNVIVCELQGNADLSPVGEGWLWPQQIQKPLLIRLDSGVVECIVK